MDHVYVALTREGLKGSHIVFRVLSVTEDGIEIEYLYRNDGWNPVWTRRGRVQRADALKYDGVKEAPAD